MITDRKIKTQFMIRLEQIPISCAGRSPYAKRGTYVEYEIECKEGDKILTPIYGRGRVIGLTTDECDIQFLVVAQFNFMGLIYERWIRPKYVIDAAESSNLFSDKASWFFSDDFLSTDVDIARQAFDLSAAQLRNNSTAKIR